MVYVTHEGVEYPSVAAQLLDLDASKYPVIHQFSEVVPGTKRPPLGREGEILSMDYILSSPEMKTVMLLGPAGVGKSALVAGYAEKYKNKGVAVFEVDLPRMSGEGDNKFAERIKQFADEFIALADEYTAKTKEDPVPITTFILFMDEMHLLTMHGHDGAGGGSSAGNAIKPLMARGEISIVGATTDEEFNRYIRNDAALTRRLQSINVPEPNPKVQLIILQDMAKRYLGEGWSDIVSDDTLLEIMDYTDRYQPAFAQPAKSIKILNTAIGRHRVKGQPINHRMIAEIMKVTAGVDVDWQTDIKTVMTYLRSRVIGQPLALEMIQDRLYVANAGLQDKGRPLANFMFAGSTGVGKALPNDTPILTRRDGQISWINNGDLKVGDFVLNRFGKWVAVTGVYPQGSLPAYRVDLSDGRSLECSLDHLWSYYLDETSDQLETSSLKEMLDQAEIWLPQAGIIDFPERDLPLDPYLVGAYLGRGDFEDSDFALDQVEPWLVDEVVSLTGARRGERERYDSVWYLLNNDLDRIRWDVIFEGIKDFDSTSIPMDYQLGSIDQRWRLMQGLFDSAGYFRSELDYTTYWYQFSNLSLAKSVLQLGYSLGVYFKDEGFGRLSLRTPVGLQAIRLFLEEGFISLQKVWKSCLQDERDRVRIAEIVDLGVEKSMTCIYIDDPEHLYLAGSDFVVTHNTELAKALTAAMFGNEQFMIRYDMSEYPLKEDVELFQHRIADAISKTPYAVVLLDELEKSHKNIMNLLLGVLDDGRLSDVYGREVTFTNCILITTTNAAHNVFREIRKQNMSVTDIDGLLRRELMGEFSPEFLGRFDEIIPFQPFSADSYEKISLLQLKKEVQKVKSRFNVDVSFDQRVATYLVQEDFAPLTDTAAGGARAMKRRIEREVVPLFARVLDEVKSSVYELAGMRVEVLGEMVAENKDLRVGTAYLAITFLATERHTGDLYKGEISKKDPETAYTLIMRGDQLHEGGNEV